MILLDRLSALFPEASRRSMKQWLEHGRVRVNGEVERRPDAPVTEGDRVVLGKPAPPPLRGPLRIVHQDERILVVDKPAGLLTIATEREREKTAYRQLSAHLAAAAGPRDKRQPLFVVHRLDRETSGLLVFARTVGVKRALQEQFAKRSVERVYVAIVEGVVRPDRGTLRSRLREDAGRRVREARRPDDGREAITHYRVLARGKDATRLELRLTTGRRGQIRAQLAGMGHPIVGDAAYGSTRDPLRRVCLHAARLGFVDDGEPRTFESPVPSSFSRLA